MSRGRGRGGARGGRGGIFAAGSSLMGELTHNDMLAMAKQTALYPETTLPETSDPVKAELRYHQCNLDYAAALKRTYAFIEDPNKDGKGDLQANVEQFSRKRAKTTLALEDPSVSKLLDRRFFPNELWQGFFEKKKPAKAARSQAGTWQEADVERLKKMTVEEREAYKKERAERLAAAEARAGADANTAQRTGEEPNSGDEGEVEEEEEEDADYDNNYFDPGEDEESDQMNDEDGGAMDF